jgi:hypothetical protein
MVGASFQGPKPPVTPLIHPFYVTFNTPLPSPGGSAPAAAGQIAEVNCALRHHIRRLTTESERRAELSKSRRVLGSAPFRRGAANPHPHCPPRCTRTACPRRARCLFCLHTTRPVTCSLDLLSSLSRKVLFPVSPFTCWECHPRDQGPRD